MKENIEEMKDPFTKSTLSEDSSSVKMKLIDLKFEKEHQFIPRDSYFDLCLDNTILQKSEFKGFFNLFGLLMIMYIITTPIYNMVIHNIPFKMTMFYKMIHDFEILLIVWPLFHFWTYLAYLLQCLILRGMPIWLTHVFQHTTQLGIFIITTIICLIKVV